MAEPHASPEFANLGFRQLVWRLSASSAVYTVGLGALRFGGLLLLPVYWRFLDPEDYGTLAAAAIVSNFLSVFLGLALSESITRFYHVWPAESRHQSLGSIWLIDWCSSLVIGVPLAIWGGAIVQLAARQVPFEPYLQLAVVSATLTSLSTAPLALLRVQERARAYVTLAAISFGARTVIAVYLVAFQKRGPLGMLEADALAGVLMIPVYAVIMSKSARLAWRPETVAEGLRFSLPLMPGVLAESLMWTLDRFVLEKYVPLRTLGIYAVGDSVASAVRIASMGLKTAWLPFQFRVAVQRDDARTVIARAGTLFVWATLVVGLTVAVLSQDLIALVGVPKYHPAASLVPAFVVPHVLLSLLPLALGGLGVTKRTGYASAAAGIQLAVGVTALFALVPRAGMYGAIIALVLATASRLAAGLFFSQRFYPVAFEWRKIGLLAGAALSVFLLGQTLPFGGSFAGLAARTALLAGYVALCAWMLSGRKARASTVVERF